MKKEPSQEEKDIAWQQYLDNIKAIDERHKATMLALWVDIEARDKNIQEPKKEKTSFLELLGIFFIGMFFWDTWF